MDVDLQKMPRSASTPVRVADDEGNVLRLSDP